MMGKMLHECYSTESFQQPCKTGFLSIYRCKNWDRTSDHSLNSHSSKGLGPSFELVSIVKAHVCLCQEEGEGLFSTDSVTWLQMASPRVCGALSPSGLPSLKLSPVRQWTPRADSVSPPVPTSPQQSCSCQTPSLSRGFRQRWLVVDAWEDLLVACYLASPRSRILSLSLVGFFWLEIRGDYVIICLFAFKETGIKHWEWSEVASDSLRPHGL